MDCEVRKEVVIALFGKSDSSRRRYDLDMRYLLLILFFLPTIGVATSAPVIRCVPSGDEVIAGVDLKEVRRVWLSWTNAERKVVGLKPLVQNAQLDRSATTWSRFSQGRGVMSHQRPGQTTYYDYPLITKWFADLGLTFKNVNRMTYSESIGYGSYSCTVNDCTQTLITALRSTFDYYLKEKKRSSRPHYGAIINAQFQIQGMGVAIDSKTKRYYVTTHYATAISSRPTPVCP